MLPISLFQKTDKKSSKDDSPDEKVENGPTNSKDKEIKRNPSEHSVEWAEQIQIKEINTNDDNISQDVYFLREEMLKHPELQENSSRESSDPIIGFDNSRIQSSVDIREKKSSTSTNKKKISFKEPLPRKHAHFGLQTEVGSKSNITQWDLLPLELLIQEKRNKKIHSPESARLAEINAMFLAECQLSMEGSVIDLDVDKVDESTSIDEDVLRTQADEYRNMYSPSMTMSTSATFMIDDNSSVGYTQTLDGNVDFENSVEFVQTLIGNLIEIIPDTTNNVIK